MSRWINSFLYDYGFWNSIYLLVSVDEIIVTRPSLHALKTFIIVPLLHLHFSLMDLGCLFTFLVLKLSATQLILLSSKRIYLQPLLSNNVYAETVETQMSPNLALTIAFSLSQTQLDTEP